MTAPVSGPIMIEKAEQLAHELRVDFSLGPAVDGIVVEKWTSSFLQDFYEWFQPNFIFNADKTGFFFHCLPDKTLAFSCKNASGGKKQKERVAVLVGANISGTEKLSLKIIGKNSKPQCFNGVKSLPLEYTSN